MTVFFFYEWCPIIYRTVPVLYRSKNVLFGSTGTVLYGTVHAWMDGFQIH